MLNNEGVTQPRSRPARGLRPVLRVTFWGGLHHEIRPVAQRWWRVAWSEVRETSGATRSWSPLAGSSNTLLGSSIGRRETESCALWERKRICASVSFSYYFHVGHSRDCVPIPTCEIWSAMPKSRDRIRNFSSTTVISSVLPPRLTRSYPVCSGLV